VLLTDERMELRKDLLVHVKKRVVKKEGKVVLMDIVLRMVVNMMFKKINRQSIADFLFG